MCREWIKILFINHYSPSLYVPGAFYSTSLVVSCGWLSVRCEEAPVLWLPVECYGCYESLVKNADKGLQ